MTTSIRAGVINNALQVNGTDVIKYDNTGMISGYSNFSVGRNLIVNGSCQVDQVNSGAIISPIAAGDYVIDNLAQVQTVTGKLSAQQITTTLNSLGATHAVRYTVLSQYTPVTIDQIRPYFAVEGLNSAHLQWGTANAAPVSVQFKARVSVAGTYSASLVGGGGVCYPFSFTLVAATDTLVKIENIPGCTTGTWVTNNTDALNIYFDLGCGPTYKAAANTWITGNYFGVTGATNLVSQVNGSTLDISDVQLEKGSYCTTFERKLYDQVLRECQRYYEIIISSDVNYQGNITTIYTSTNSFVKFPHKVNKRTIPSVLNNSINVGIYSNGAGTSSSTISYTYADIASTSLRFTTSTITSGIVAHTDWTSGSVAVSARI